MLRLIDLLTLGLFGRLARLVARLVRIAVVSLIAGFVLVVLDAILLGNTRREK